MARGVDKLSKATRAHALWPSGSSSSPGQLALGSEGPRGPPAVPCDSSPGPRARGDDHISRVTRARAQVPTGSTRCPVRLQAGSEGPGFDQFSWETCACVRGPAGLTSSPGRLGPMQKSQQGQPDVPGDSGPVPRDCRLNQISWATHAWVRGPTGSTPSPGQIALGSDGPRCQPALRGDLGPCSSARTGEQMSRAIPAWL